MRNPFTAPTIRRALLTNAPCSGDEPAFFSHLRLPNGTFKTTHPGRLCDVNEWLLPYLPATKQPLQVLDVGVSSGTLTAELDELLADRGVPHQTFGSDLYLEARCLQTGPWTVLYLDPEVLLQVDLFHLAFPNTPPSRLSAFVFGLARRRLARARRQAQPIESVPLLSVSARTSHVEFSSGDVFGCVYERDPDLRFDVIRAANVLNQSYFSDDAIRGAIGNLRRHLRDDGLLLLLRSDGETNRATLLRAGPNGLTEAASLHGGVEIAPLAVNL